MSLNVPVTKDICIGDRWSGFILSWGTLVFLMFAGCPGPRSHQEPTLAPRELPVVEGIYETRADLEPVPARPKTERSTQQTVPPTTPVVRTPSKECPQNERGQPVGNPAQLEDPVAHESIPSLDSETQERPSVGSSIPSLDSDTLERRTAESRQATGRSGPGIPKTVRLVLDPPEYTANVATLPTASASVQFENGDDILDLALPDTMALSYLLLIAGEHLDLDYVYDPATVGKQSVALRIRGGLQGEIRIKELYTLLETVLKFNGLAMIRREEKLVTIVPVDQALSTAPPLLDVPGGAVRAGDTVLTRVFKLQFVDAPSVTNVLQNMKLGVTISTSEEAQILFVTCYAHNVDRIEQLVGMLDRPGKPRECRLRWLEYTLASALTDKVRTLAQELQGFGVGMAPTTPKPSTRGPAGAGSTALRQSVYLDTDERTNRIVMIGYGEQLTFLEDLIDVLDVAQEDLRTARTYNVKHMTAQEALNMLQELEAVGPSAASVDKPRQGVSTASSSRAGTAHVGALTVEPVVVVLEATNQLLVKATAEQHERIAESLDHIDVSRRDLRTLEVYRIQHVDASEVRNKLEELDIISMGTARLPTSAAPSRAGTARISATSANDATGGFMDEPQVVVTETTNSLLVNATAEQHDQIATIISHVDSKMPEEELSHKIYPLENSSPAHIADILEQLLQEAAKDKDDKIETVLEPEEQIIIVPDPNTFSLVVYAGEKNHEWIEELTKSLDKRRPQVLIDVTLVEITRTDTFEYDLNIVASGQEAVIGNIGIEPIHRLGSSSRLEGGFNLLDQEGSPTGQTKAFYSDEKVQALLTAIKRKSYGRVLAKPKILVDDGQEGEISTTDTTTYSKESIQIPDQGSPITTRDYEPIEAMIQLQITPHISEGDLLRLDVSLSREDFGSRPDKGAPPDKASSKVTTTVFVPDDHTVILGGLVKLNQSKGGSKVPILGDIPLVGALFRSVDNSDVEKKLYVFLKANIVRPYDEAGLGDLRQMSEEHQEAFQESEAEFQKHEDIPGIRPKPMQPARVLDEL